MTTRAKLIAKRAEKTKNFLSYISKNRINDSGTASQVLPLDPNEVDAPTQPRDHIERTMSVPILSLETKRKLSGKTASQPLMSFSKYDLYPGSDSEEDLDLMSMSGEPNYVDLSMIQDPSVRKSVRITKAILTKSTNELRAYSDSLKFPQFDDEVVAGKPEDDIQTEDVSMSEESTQIARNRLRSSVSVSRPFRIPPLPKTATENDRNRVRVLQEILNTEIDYIRCLRKLVALRDLVAANGSTLGLNEEQVERMFAGIPDILDSHEMFYMSMSGKLKQMPEDFNIVLLEFGPDCISAFSREIVTISYTKYSAHFTSVLDQIVKQQMANENFTKMIKKFESDMNESLKTALLRPIEIFPKYIYLVGELLRYTDASHSDHCSLGNALAGLESMAIRLGVIRRESELKEQFLQLQSRIITIGKDFFRSGSRKLIRIEPVIKLSRKNGRIKPKFRYIFIFNDHILCLRGAKRPFMQEMLVPDLESGATLLSQYFLEWSTPIESVDVKVREKAENLRVYREIVKILNEELSQKKTDLDILKQIDLLVTQLYGDYQGLTKVNVQNSIAHLSHDLKSDLIYTSTQKSHAIEINLTRGPRQKRYIYYLGSIDSLKEFVLTFRYSKLRMQPENIQGWLTFSPESEHKMKYLHNHPMQVDYHTVDTMYANCSVICATLVHEGIVWLCCGNLRLGLIIILNTQGKTIEKILQHKVCAERISVVHFMPAFQSTNECFEVSWVYPTVWVGTESGKLYIFDATIPTRIDLNVETDCPDTIVSMENFEDTMFIGLANGDLMVFDLGEDSQWDGICRFSMNISELSISSIHVITESLWCFSGNRAFIFSPTQLNIVETVTINNDPSLHVLLTAPFGNAIWLCMKQTSELLLFHVLHKEILQTVSLNRFFKQMKMEGLIENEAIKISSLLATHGSLWVGTTEGIILNYELHDGVPVFVGQTSMSRDSHIEGAKEFLFISKNIGQRCAPKFQNPRRDPDMLELDDGYWTQTQMKQQNACKAPSIPSAFEASNILLEGDLKIQRVSSDPTKTEEGLPRDFTSPLAPNSARKRPLSQTSSFPPKLNATPQTRHNSFPLTSDAMYDNQFKPSEETIQERSFEDSTHIDPNSPVQNNSTFKDIKLDEAIPPVISGINPPPPKPPRFQPHQSSESLPLNGHVDDLVPIGTEMRQGRSSVSSDVTYEEIRQRNLSAEYSQSSLEDSENSTANNSLASNAGPVSIKQTPKPFSSKFIDLTNPSHTEKIWEMVEDVKLDKKSYTRDPYVIMKSPSKTFQSPQIETMTKKEEQEASPYVQLSSFVNKPRERSKTEIGNLDGEGPEGRKPLIPEYSMIRRNLTQTDDMEQVPHLVPPTANEYFVLSSETRNSNSYRPKKRSVPNLSESGMKVFPTKRQVSGVYTKLKMNEALDLEAPTYERLILNSDGRPISISPDRKLKYRRTKSDSVPIQNKLSITTPKNSNEPLSERESAWMDIHLDSYYVLSAGGGYFDWRVEGNKPSHNDATNPTLILWELPITHNL